MLYSRQILFNGDYTAFLVILFNLNYTTILVMLLNLKYAIFTLNIIQWRLYCVFDNTI